MRRAEGANAKQALLSLNILIVISSNYCLSLTAYGHAVERGGHAHDGHGVAGRGDQPVGAAAKVGAGHFGGGGLLLRAGDVDAVEAHGGGAGGAVGAALGALRINKSA